MHKGVKCQKPARNWNKIFGKLAVSTYALTNLEYEVHPFTGNGNVESGLKNQNVGKLSEFISGRF